MMTSSNDLETITWIGGTDGYLRIIDQTKLPTQICFLDCQDVQTVWEAIKMLRVRGAPAIGIAAAYGVCIGLQVAKDSQKTLVNRLGEVTTYLATSRPTAVNLFWALDRIKAAAESLGDDISTDQFRATMLNEARAIHREDRNTCRAIGKHGASLLQSNTGVLTHCNAGGLATSEYGTALSVFFTAQDEGKQLHVFIDETRPLLQGSRLTAWELMQRQIPATLICDSMAAQVMREGKIQAVVTGADRIASNGDAANKIGTYSVAVLANAHGIPFYIAAPKSTFDFSISNGQEIPIEQRNSAEITHGFGCQTAPNNVEVYNPAFDVTPANLITAIITEHGIIEPVNATTIRKVLKITA